MNLLMYFKLFLQLNLHIKLGSSFFNIFYIILLNSA